MKRAVGLTMATVGFVACAGTTQPRATVAERPVDVPVVPSADKPAEPPPPCAATEAGVRAFSADGSTLAVARGTTAVVLDVAGFKERSAVDVGAPIRRIALSAKGDYLIVVGAEEPPARGTLMLARTRDGNVLLQREHEVATMLQHEKAVFSSDDRWLALAVPDGPEDGDDNIGEHVEILELPSLTQRGSIAEPTTVTDLPHPHWRPRRLAPVRRPSPRGASGPMGPPMLMNAGGPTPNSPPDWSADKLEAGQHGVLDLQPAASTLLVEWAAGAVSLVDASSGKALATLLAMPSGGGVLQHSLSPSGRFAVVPRNSGAVAIFDRDQHQGRLFYDPLCPGSSSAASFNHTEDAAVIGGWSFAVCVVDLKSGKLRTLLPPKPPAHGAFEDEGIRAGGPWRADDRSVVVQDMAGQPVVWDLGTKTGTPVALDARTARNTEARPKDGSLVFFDDLGKPMAELVGTKLSYLPPNDSDELASATSPDAELVLLGLTPPLTLLSSRTGKPVATLKDAQQGIYGFDPIGRFVYTTDEALFVWRTDSGAVAYKDPPRCK